MEEVDNSFGQGELWKVSYFYGTAEGVLNPKKEEVLDVGFFEEKDLEDLDIAYDHKEVLKRFFKMPLSRF